MVFCNINTYNLIRSELAVTILILIDGFLQFKYTDRILADTNSHNPYFNRWFSAIKERKEYEQNKIDVTILILIDGFLQ